MARSPQTVAAARARRAQANYAAAVDALDAATAERKEAMVALRETGSTVYAIAEIFSTGPTYVSNVLASARERAKA